MCLPREWATDEEGRVRTCTETIDVLIASGCSSRVPHSATSRRPPSRASVCVYLWQ